MPDPFAQHAAALDAPASHAFAISPSDADDLPSVTRALYVGSGGAIAVHMLSGETAVFTNVASGTVLPLRLRRVLETGTSATDLVGLN